MAMDKQATFDKVVAALIQQNERSAIRVDTDDEHSHEQCQYRGPNGLKCAIGHLIPDELYKPGMESKGISALYTDYPEVFSHLLALSEQDRDFLIRLQIVHDEYAPEMWPKAFRDVADDFELNATVVE